MTKKTLYKVTALKLGVVRTTYYVADNVSQLQAYYTHKYPSFQLVSINSLLNVNVVGQ